MEFEMFKFDESFVAKKSTYQQLRDYIRKVDEERFKNPPSFELK